jgi:hypothetical protein
MVASGVDFYCSQKPIQHPKLPANRMGSVKSFHWHYRVVYPRESQVVILNVNHTSQYPKK